MPRSRSTNSFSKAYQSKNMGKKYGNVASIAVDLDKGTSTLKNDNMNSLAIYGRKKDGPYKGERIGLDLVNRYDNSSQYLTPAQIKNSRNPIPDKPKNSGATKTEKLP